MYGEGSILINPAQVSSPLFSEMIEMYVDGFNSAPWNEGWTFPSAAEYLRNCRQKTQSVIAIAPCGKAASFGMAQPLIEYEHPEELFQMGASKRAYYISEVVTVATFRGKGFGKLVVGLHLLLARKNHDEVVLRTRIDNYPMHKLAQSIGFEEIGRYDGVSNGIVSPRSVFSLKF